MWTLEQTESVASVKSEAALNFYEAIIGFACKLSLFKVRAQNGNVMHF